MKALTILVFGILFSGCANYNSNTFDGSTYQGVATQDSDPNFSAAYTILRNQCSSCHGEFTALTTNAAWVATGRVLKNDPDHSTVITKLYLFGGAGNMPPSNQLSSPEYQTLRTWIQNMP